MESLGTRLGSRLMCIHMQNPHFKDIIQQWECFPWRFSLRFFEGAGGGSGHETTDCMLTVLYVTIESMEVNLHLCFK